MPQSTPVPVRPFSTFNDLFGSRALDTIYQNTSGRPMWINVIIGILTGVECTLTIGSSSPPSTYIDNDIIHEKSLCTLQGLIPVNWYYRVDVNVGSPAILDWFESY
jgi:hypothetical protein